MSTAVSLDTGTFSTAIFDILCTFSRLGFFVILSFRFFGLVFFMFMYNLLSFAFFYFPDVLKE